MRTFPASVLIGSLMIASNAQAEGDAPAPAPVTRPGIKQVLEGSKHSKPRLPLPPLTEADKARAEAAASGKARGPMGGIVNNGRMRNYYLEPEFRGEFYVKPTDLAKADPKSTLRLGADPSMPLDPTFRIMFFWLVARANNCYYCLGHQEVKLQAAGVSDDRLAALDADWSEFKPAEAAAFAFVKKLSRTPQDVNEADIEALRRRFNDREILDILFSTGNYVAMTRWTGGLAIPQEDHRVYLTPTSEKYVDLPSVVAPIDPTQVGSQTVCKPLAANRPPLESRQEVESRLTAARSRKPRLPLVADDEARALLPQDWPSTPLPQWIRLLANFPDAGKARINSILASGVPGFERGSLDRTLRAQIAWIAARQDRAWYALGHAKQRLNALGQSDDAIYGLDDPAEDVAPMQRAVFHLARKLTVDPALVTDSDVEAVRKHLSDRETAEVVYFITVAGFFDRVTEAAGLQLEF